MTSWLDEMAMSWLDDVASVPDAQVLTGSAVRADDFRGIVGSFPSGITVVTTLDDGAPRGATVTAFASISLVPPIVMISLAVKSRTLAAIRRHGAFAVHVLESSATALSQRFAAPTSSFAGVQSTPSARARRVPVLQSHTVAHAECLVHSIRVVGDHAVVLGLVVDGRASEGTPLIYHRRDYHGWPPSRPRLLTTVKEFQ